MTSTRPTPKRADRLVALALLLAVVPALALTSEARADDDEDAMPWYLEFQAGPSFIPNQTLTSGNAGGRVEPDRPDSSGGFNIGGAFGRHFTDLLRAELALTYREVGINGAGLGSSAPNTVADGDLSMLAFMANVYADFDPGIGITPFVGFGLGFGEVKFDIRQPVDGVLEIDDADIVFAYNAMVGASMQLTKTVEISTTYRYIATPENEDIGGSNIGGVTQSIESEFDSHEIVAGLRFRF